MQDAPQTDRRDRLAGNARQLARVSHRIACSQYDHYVVRNLAEVKDVPSRG